MLLSIQDLRVAFRTGKVGGVVQRTEAVGRGEVGVGVGAGQRSDNAAWTD